MEKPDVPCTSGFFHARPNGYCMQTPELGMPTLREVRAR